MVESPVLDLSARLLANENINVIRSNTRTASFDLQSRTLTLPQWKEITPEVDQMLVAHEVSHALFTPQLYSTAIKADPRLQFKQSHDYVNIIEDARVERLMKNRYPGIRKTFFIGYKQLNDLDFFGVQDISLGDLSLIDRINLYYKAGFNCGVQFSQAEMRFVRRIDNLEEFEDVIALAREIYDFDVNQHNKLAQETDTPPSEGESGEEHGDDDGEEDSYEDESDAPEKGSEKSSLSGGTGDSPDPEVTTAKKFNDRLNSLADTNTIYRYYTLGSMAYDPVVPFKKILTKAKAIGNTFPHIQESERQVARTFKQKNQNNVDYLVKEFEMKKAATAYNRTQTAKSGSLNSNRLWAYKLSDDVFKRIQIVQKDKNHGMVFLLDWSGSMAKVIDDTLDQVINLAMFCQRTGIKYRVYTFATKDVQNNLSPEEAAKYRNLQRNTPVQRSDIVIDPTSGRFMMMELFSDRMSLPEFTDMVKYIKGRRILRDFRLGGTPLNHALIHMYNTLDNFKHSNGVEKVSFITLTDGEGSKLDEVENSYYHKNVHHFIRDTYTKSTYSMTADPYSATRVLLKMIKERHQCTTLGFYIMPPNDARNVIRDHYGSLANAPRNILDQMKSQIRQQGYASLPDTGRDELFVVPASKVQISYGSLEIDEDASVRSIASSFNKFLNKQKTSRFLLDKFIAHIA